MAPGTNSLQSLAIDECMQCGGVGCPTCEGKVINSDNAEDFLLSDELDDIDLNDY